MHLSNTITTSNSLRVRLIGRCSCKIEHRPGEEAGHGNDRVWKAWKAMKPASHPSRTLWKSLRDSHIPTASTTGFMSSHAPFNSKSRHRKGLVTDVSGPQRNACPGTLTDVSGPQRSACPGTLTP